MDGYDCLFVELDKFDHLFGIYAESMRIYQESLAAMSPKVFITTTSRTDYTIDARSAQDKQIAELSKEIKQLKTRIFALEKHNNLMREALDTIIVCGSNCKSCVTFAQYALDDENCP